VVIISELYTKLVVLACIEPPTYKSPPIPTPPLTTNAPVVVEVLDILFVIEIVPVTVFTTIIVLDHNLDPFLYPKRKAPSEVGIPRSGSA
jgi:hypothetical protein